MDKIVIQVLEIYCFTKFPTQNPADIKNIVWMNVAMINTLWGVSSLYPYTPGGKQAKDNNRAKAMLSKIFFP